MVWETFGPIVFCMLNYWRTRGRATRQEYWTFSTFVTVSSIVLGELNWGVALVFTLVTAVPSWAVTVRRLHDTNRGGWVLLLGFTPLSLLLFYFLAQESVDPNYFDS